MKIVKTLLVVTASALLLTSCKDEKKEKVELLVKNYTTYIDSISKVAVNDAASQWQQIENQAENKKMEVEAELSTLDDKTEYEKIIETSSQKYNAFKESVSSEIAKLEAAKTKYVVRNALFKQDIADDMSFSWVNKDNILSVYDNFVTTVDKNKDSYSREDWDEIKLLYEALDNRKNTVEKEGLSGGDNLKIAGLKLKFAPMYKINRVGAKAEENKESKQ
jgi:hypothetical protein